MLTWIIVFVVFGVLILIHEAGHLIAAKRAGIRVEAFSLGMGKRLFGKQIGETDYRVSMIPFGGFCQMAGEDPSKAEGAEYEFASKPVGSRFWVIIAGSLTNYIFAFILFSVIFMIGVPTLSNKVGRVLDNYPAKKAGIEVGDRILSINGMKVEYWEDVVAKIKIFSAEENPLDLRVLRDGAEKDIEVKPDISRIKNIFGQTIDRPMIGIAPMNEVSSVSYNPIEAVYYGGKRLIVLTGMTYKGVWLLITGGMPVKDSLTGPIGIAFTLKTAANEGIVPLMALTALISMALAIFNLLPIPVLDGGHILFLLIEKIRGRAVELKTQEIVSTVAIVLLCAFAFFVSWQDVLKVKAKVFERPGEKVQTQENASEKK